MNVSAIGNRSIMLHRRSCGLHIYTSKAGSAASCTRVMTGLPVESAGTYDAMGKLIDAQYRVPPTDAETTIDSLDFNQGISWALRIYRQVTELRAADSSLSLTA